MKKYLFLFVALFSTCLSFAQDAESLKLKKEVSKLIKAFNMQDVRAITDFVYPKIFTKEFTPEMFQWSLVGFAAMNPGNSELGNDNSCEIKNISGHKFSVIQYVETKEEKMSFKKDISAEEVNSYFEGRSK